MLMTLSQAAPAAVSMTWPQAVVAIVSALVPVALGVLQLLRERGKRKAEAAARAEAELERDALIEGVERAGDTMTKATIKKTAAERGAATLDASVKRVTGRLAGLLLGVGLLFLAGCCTVDHEGMAALAERRRALLSEAASLPLGDLPLEVAREILAEDARAWEVTRARLGGAPVTSATEAWLQSGGLR